MKALILDCETLPADAEEHRHHLAAHGLAWPMPPMYALGRVETEEPKPAPSTWVDEAKIARREVENANRAWLTNQQRALDWWRAGSLQPHRARVLCVSMSCGEDEVTATGTESEICAALDEVLVRMQPTHLVAWNAPFDAAHIQAMALRGGRRWDELARTMTIAHYSFIAQLRGEIRRRGPQWVDAMQGWGASRIKLEHACAMVGIDHLDREVNPIDGSQVLDAYMLGMEPDIVRHCEADVRDLWRVWEHIAEWHGIRLERAEINLETA